MTPAHTPHPCPLPAPSAVPPPRLALAVRGRARPMTWLGCTPGDQSGPADMTPLPDPQVRIAHFLVDIPSFDICVKGPGTASLPAR